jgi:hypothetical protein
MNSNRLIVAGVFLLLLGCGGPPPSDVPKADPPATADEPTADPPAPPVKLGKVPDLRLTPRPPVGEAQVKRIKSLIAGLEALDKPDFGLSRTFSGRAFAPVAGQSRAGVMLLADHRLQPSENLRELVALGPDALPFLLDALDDETPTRLTIKNDDRFGVLGYGVELHPSPVNPAEAAHKARLGPLRPLPSGGGHIDFHTVTIGDVCFVAVGQIVGRSYNAVRYQPSATVVVNSPTHDARLCATVRSIWASRDPARKLFDSLLADYATEGIFNGRTLDGWGVGSKLQCGAALRLLYYFSKETTPLIADRLGKLDVGSDDGVRDYVQRCVANGVCACDFLKAVSWSKEPAVRAALTAVFKRAENHADLLAALPGIDDMALIRARLEPRVEKLPAEENGPYGDGYNLLKALAERTPDTAKAVFQKYLRDAGHQRHRTVCLVLAEVKVPWDAEVLGPLLDDKREGYRTYPTGPGKDAPQLHTRICDEAAFILARNHPELKFTLAGSHADLDKQIAVIREQLDRTK